MKSFVINLENNIPKEMEKSCKFYHADTDKKQDAIDIKNANDLWLTKQLLSVSPTMTNGISFSPKDEFNNDIIHFDNTVQFVSNTSCCSRDLFQQLLRVRHLKSKHIYIYVESDTILNKKLTETFYENYEDYFVNFIKKKKEACELEVCRLKNNYKYTRINVEYAFDETPPLLSQVEFYNQLEDGLSRKAFIENMKLFMNKCNYNYTIEKIQLDNKSKNDSKPKLNKDELQNLYKYYNNLEYAEATQLKLLRKKQSKDKATIEDVHQIEKYYFMTFFDEFNPEIFEKLFRNTYNIHIIKNLYTEKNRTIVDEFTKDLQHATNYVEYIKHRSSKLFHIEECNKILNIEHSNVEVDSISQEDFSKIKIYVEKNKKDIQIAFNITCHRDIDIIKNMYSKWSGANIKTVYKDKLNKKISHYEIKQPEINKNLYDKLILRHNSSELTGTCQIHINGEV